MTACAKNLWDKWTGSAFVAFFRRRRVTILYILFIAVALAQGLAYSFLVPMGQVPDELSHYDLMEQEFGTDGYTEELQNRLFVAGGFEAVKWHPDVKVNPDAVAAVAQEKFTKGLSITDFHPTVRIVCHLPAGIVFYLGVLLGLPMLTCTYLAEIFSVLFFVGIGFLTIRTAPVKKEIFAFCLLIPETLQQCASVSYDAVLIPVAFLLFAYVLRLYERETPVRWKQLCAVAGLSLVLLLIKPPYVLIGLTLLMIPASKFELKIGKKIEIAHLIRKYWYVALLLLAVVGGLGVYLTRNSSIMKTILADVISLGDFIRMLTRTFRQNAGEYLHMMIGVFGWLESRVSVLFVVICMCVMVWLNAARVERPAREINAGRRVWLAVVFFFVAMASLIGIQEWSYQFLGADTVGGIEVFQNHINNLDHIIGYQGRYLTPALPVLLVALSGKLNRENRKTYWLVQAGYYAYAFIMVFHVLRTRYWG